MKTPLLLLHGALGSRDQFQKLKAELQKSFEVCDLNFEGHGSRPSAHQYSIDLFTGNVIDFLTEQHLPTINIFGYSMGGYVALNLALKAPGRVGKIVTLGTKFDWTAESAAREVRMLNPDKIEEKVPAFAEQLQSIHFGNDWKAVVRKTAGMMTALGSGQSLSADDLQQIATPVLVGIGDQDKMVSIAESEQAAGLLPGGTLKILKGVEHPIGKADPTVLASVIVNFLKT